MSRTITFLPLVGFFIIALPSCNAFLPRQTPAPTPTLAPTRAFTSTATETPILTPILTHTLTPPPSSTSRPSITPTPQPEWVTGFAQPILDLISIRPPDFQDDFSRQSAGWRLESYCGAWRMKYQDGELVLTSCGAFRSDINVPDFVAEIDGRFLPGTTGGASWMLYFGDFAGEGHLLGQPYGFGVTFEGSVNLSELGEENPGFPNAAIPGYQVNHLLVIARGARFAFYINHQPLYYAENASMRSGNIWFRAWGSGPHFTENPSIVAFDNFRVWDLSSISVP